MRHLKIMMVLCCAICISAVLTGCKVAFSGITQIKDIEFIRAVGIDKNDGNIRLTIATQRIISGGGRGGSEQKQSDIMCSEGETGFEAIRNFWSHSEKRPFFGHLEYILIGEEAAKDGLLKYLDFFTRDPEIRLNLDVFIVKGAEAGDVIRQGNTSDKFVFDRLEGIKRHHWGLSMINEVELMEVMYILDTDYLSLYVPCVKLLMKTESTTDGNKGMDIALEGFGVFEGDRLAGYLEREMARGLNFLKNKVKSGVMSVKSRKGEKVGLEIISSDRKMKPYITGDELRVAIELDVNCNIVEIQSIPGNIFNDESIDFLKTQLEELIKDEIRKVIDFAQEMKLDYFGAADAVLHKYPCKWEDIFENGWRDIFSEIEFEITVNSQISRTYDIKQPIGSKDIV